MDILHISYDYFSTTVYRNLFKVLNFKNNLTCVVPLEIDQKNKFEIFEEDNIIPIFYGRPRACSVQLNAKKYSEIIDEKIDLSRYKLVHAHFTLNDGLIALKLKKAKGIPYVISVRASCIMNLKRKVAFHNYFTVLSVLINSKAIFFQTESVFKELLANTPLPFRKNIKKKYFIVHNGIDDFWHENSFKRNYELDTREFTIITAASVEKNKNLINVAQAINELNNQGYKIKYLIAGIVKEEKILRALISFGFITYLGVLDKCKLRDAYRNSDIFIMLSHRETFGLVYAEAMSQGLPVIYTKGQGFDRQFEEGLVGLHSSAINLVEIKDVILQVAANYKSMSSNASKLVPKFNWEAIAKKYNLIYSNLL